MRLGVAGEVGEHDDKAEALLERAVLEREADRLISLLDEVCSEEGALARPYN